MKPRIYLAGLISTDYAESLNWRIRATELLTPDLEVVTPMRGKDCLALYTKDGGVTDPSRTPKDVILRDFNDVRACNALLVHLESFGCPRPLVGTIMELAWAWQLRKPVVAICAEDNYLMRQHPFVAECVAHYYSTLERAIEGIRQVV